MNAWISRDANFIAISIVFTMRTLKVCANTLRPRSLFLKVEGNMFVIEKLDLKSAKPTWEAIESSWEFKNSSESLSYACEVAKVLAMRFSNDSQFRVFDNARSSVVATYYVTHQLISATLEGTSVEVIDRGTEIPMVSQIAKSYERDRWL